jgi:hypothetical protein
LHKPSVVYNDILWVLDWKAAFEAADTYTRALAPGLLEVFFDPRLQKGRHS